MMCNSKNFMCQKLLGLTYHLRPPPTHSSLPHGWLSLTTAIVSTIAVSLSLNTLSNCRFVIVQGYGDVIYRGFGLTTYEMYENSCQGYYESWNRGDELPTTAASQLGTMAVTGRVFGI